MLFFLSNFLNRRSMMHFYQVHCGIEYTAEVDGRDSRVLIQFCVGEKNSNYLPPSCDAMRRL